MSDIQTTIEGLLRLFVLMIPVAGVLLLFVAAHLAGGALKIRRRESQQPPPQDERQRQANRSREPHYGEHNDSQPTHAA